MRTSTPDLSSALDQASAPVLASIADLLRTIASTIEAAPVSHRVATIRPPKRRLAFDDIHVPFEPFEVIVAIQDTVDRSALDALLERAFETDETFGMELEAEVNRMVNEFSKAGYAAGWQDRGRS